MTIMVELIYKSGGQYTQGIPQSPTIESSQELLLADQGEEKEQTEQLQTPHFVEFARAAHSPSLLDFYS
jgi:hypothetical protein